MLSARAPAPFRHLSRPGWIKALAVPPSCATSAVASSAVGARSGGLHLQLINTLTAKRTRTRTLSRPLWQESQLSPENGKVLHQRGRHKNNSAVSFAELPDQFRGGDRPARKSTILSYSRDCRRGSVYRSETVMSRFSARANPCSGRRGFWRREPSTMTCTETEILLQCAPRWRASDAGHRAARLRWHWWRHCPQLWRAQNACFRELQQAMPAPQLRFHGARELAPVRHRGKNVPGRRLKRASSRRFRAEGLRPWARRLINCDWRRASSVAVFSNGSGPAGARRILCRRTCASLQANPPDRRADERTSIW